jgi:hypothetical protein
MIRKGEGTLGLSTRSRNGLDRKKEKARMDLYHFAHLGDGLNPFSVAAP